MNYNLTTFKSNSGGESLYNGSNNNDDNSISNNNILEHNLDTIGGGAFSRNSHMPSFELCSWRKTKCDLVNEVGDFVVKRQVVCDLREVVLDDDIGKDHVGIAHLALSK
jgi:hypothetical protein